MHDSDLDRLIRHLATTPVDPRLGACDEDWLAHALVRSHGVESLFRIGGAVATVALLIGIVGSGSQPRHDLRAQLFPFAPASVVTFVDAAIAI